MVSGKFKQGTAFFISPTILLTAGHVGPTKGQKVAIQPPGKLTLNRHFSNLWRASKEDGPHTDVFNCKVLKTLYNKDNVDIDISVLKSLEYRASTWVPIDMSMPLATESAIDLVAYPGDAGLVYLSQVQRFDVSAEDRSSINSILPVFQLIVSHGEVLQENHVRPSYKLSTTYGMSGGAIIFQGKAVGEIPSQRFYSDEAVHSSGNVETHNKCVALNNILVREMIEKILNLENKPGIRQRLSRTFGIGRMDGPEASSSPIKLPQTN